MDPLVRDITALFYLFKGHHSSEDIHKTRTITVTVQDESPLKMVSCDTRWADIAPTRPPPAAEALAPFNHDTTCLTVFSY
ncbi:unnamed protein product [Pieris brassicae]|uniref:Uncharacterized protein n=1 Tax=Pieris brassicae TaxID=7116 RepID=A0A9P0T4W9_PIEBR|nr:unnamed protein product [Pieris brassicae]